MEAKVNGMQAIARKKQSSIRRWAEASLLRGYHLRGRDQELKLYNPHPYCMFNLLKDQRNWPANT